MLLKLLQITLLLQHDYSSIFCDYRSCEYLRYYLFLYTKGDYR